MATVVVGVSELRYYVIGNISIWWVTVQAVMDGGNVGGHVHALRV